ncbi:MAG: hypothetical protein EBS48_07365 [Actinobacteria bacterium]|nr:hypothetical protein [Actinomycetota bacterium]NBU16817.1 hypothetical protein [Actinomycetota bacterium]
MTPVFVRVLRPVCGVIFVAGIAGIIVTSINGNNAGWVLTIGMVTAVAAVVLIAVTAALPRPRIDVFDDVVAERVEQRIAALVAAGADEAETRALVRDALEMVRGQK